MVLAKGVDPPNQWRILRLRYGGWDRRGRTIEFHFSWFALDTQRQTVCWGKSTQDQVSEWD